MATTKTVGQVKVEALKERLLSINPSAEITALQQIFTAETAESFQLDSYDYIIDAIDSLKDKALLILMCPKAKNGPGDPNLLNHEWCSSKAQINGTLAQITAIFGFMLAGLVVQDAVNR